MEELRKISPIHYPLAIILNIILLHSVRNTTLQLEGLMILQFTDLGSVQCFKRIYFYNYEKEANYLPIITKGHQRSSKEVFCTTSMVLYFAQSIRLTDQLHILCFNDTFCDTLYTKGNFWISGTKLHCKFCVCV